MEDEFRIEEEVSGSCEFATSIQECIVELEPVLNAKRDNQTTKLRVMYDASAKSERSLPSLNDCLYVGPPLSLLIFGIS